MSEKFEIRYTNCGSSNFAGAFDGASSIEIEADDVAGAASAFKCLYPSATVQSIRRSGSSPSRSSKPIDFAMDGVPV